MDEQLKAFLSTIYGEAAMSSPATWKAIASTILNRVGHREWHKLKTPLSVIANSGFDAFTQQNQPFRKAWEYFGGNRAAMFMRLEDLEAEVRGIYDGTQPRTTDAVLYYSPKAQAFLHERDPDRYRSSRPHWNFDRLLPVTVNGCEADDFAWFKYKDDIA